MKVLIAINIIVILLNTGLLFYLFVEVMRLKQDFKTKFEMIEKHFETRINELSEAVKFLTKLNLKKIKDNEDKSKIVPFKPEDVEKIREVINASSN